MPTQPATTPPATHRPQGVPTQIDVPDESLWQGFDARVRAEPQAVGLHFLGRDFTWGELGSDALWLAGALQRQGVRPGDRVILFMQNCPFTRCCARAVWWCRSTP